LGKNVSMQNIAYIFLKSLENNNIQNMLTTARNYFSFLLSLKGIVIETINYATINEPNPSLQIDRHEQKCN